ncbi:Uncharacterized protein dnm_038270 [Desulfonema magnum]|uniref:Uncharacterized protein n=1 Tax=Desulfonema magnum TaxID=45655 RepID=A0A975BMT6_9BACT|nr:Uncharacterized protein dnm_038270 [Desulfonema magnum]
MIQLILAGDPNVRPPRLSKPRRSFIRQNIFGHVAVVQELKFKSEEKGAYGLQF